MTAMARIEVEGVAFGDEARPALVAKAVRMARVVRVTKNADAVVQLNAHALELVHDSAAGVHAQPSGAARPGRSFDGRMDNWRRVVRDAAGSSASGCCAAWAKWYVAMRVSAAAPAQDVMEERIKPLRGVVSADYLDGWMVEAAWRMLGDYNDRMALKAKYIYHFPNDRVRTHLKGVRGSHVQLVVARAEQRLQVILKALERAETILG